MYIYHHFYLKATNCPKGTVDSTGCQFRNDRVSYVWFFELLFAELVKKKSGIWKGEEPALTHVFFCLCAFMQPLIDCTVCYKTYRDQIEQEPKPYVHCVHKMALTQVSLLAAVTNTHSKHGTRLHQIVSDFFSRFTFTSFSWTTGDEDDQSGALQPGGLQQWIPNPPGINRNRVMWRPSAFLCPALEPLQSALQAKSTRVIVSCSSFLTTSEWDLCVTSSAVHAKR